VKIIVNLSFAPVKTSMKWMLLLPLTLMAVHPSGASESASRSADPIVGQWRWPTAQDQVVQIKADGTFWMGDKAVGRWNVLDVKQRSYLLRWDEGQWEDRAALSENGQKLRCRTLENHRFTAERVSLRVLPAAKAKTTSELPRAVTEAFTRFDKTVAEVTKRSGDKARAALESELKHRTRSGDLDAALATKNALQSLDARLEKLQTGAFLPPSPVGKWERQDGRVLIIETNGKGTIIRGNESPEPLLWKLADWRYALTFPTLTEMPGIVTYIWPENDGSWGYAFTDGKKVGNMKKLP
jgi:hypothetical protein